MVMLFMAVVMTDFQKGNLFRSVQSIFPGNGICHKILQTCAGDDDSFRSFQSAHLINSQRVVVQTGNRFCDQAGYSQICAFTQLDCELVNRQAGGGNIIGFLLTGTAGQQH